MNAPTEPRPDFPADDFRSWLTDGERLIVGALDCADLSVDVSISVKLSEFSGKRTPKNLTTEQIARQDVASQLIRIRANATNPQMLRGAIQMIATLRQLLHAAKALVAHIGRESAELRAERDELRAIVEACEPYVGDGIDVGYGGFHGGDPRDFTPDPECSTEAEQANWRAACESFAGTAMPDTHTLVTDEGGLVMHVARNPFGLGTYVSRDDETVALHGRIVEAMRAADLGGAT